MADQINEQTAQGVVTAMTEALLKGGSTTVLVAVSVPSSHCKCGKPDCSGAIALTFQGARPVALEIIDKLLERALSPDELANYARSLLEKAYNLKQPQHAPLHRMRFRGGNQN